MAVPAVYEVLISDDYIHVKTPYDPKFVQWARDAGGRWDDSNRSWSFAKGRVPLSSIGSAIHMYYGRRPSLVSAFSQQSSTSRSVGGTMTTVTAPDGKSAVTTFEPTPEFVTQQIREATVPGLLALARKNLTEKQRVALGLMLMQPDSKKDE